MKNYFSREKMVDFLETLLLILSVDYLLLFGAETVLPGLVMDVFNLNYLLIFVVTAALSLVFLKREHLQIDECAKENYLLKAFYWFMFLVIMISLYKVSNWEILLYSLASVFLVIIFRRSFFRSI